MELKLLFDCFHRKKHTAFSLVEMLMALLVASLVLAALAPVITKRMNESAVSIYGNTDSSILSCGFVNDSLSDITYNADCYVPENVHTMSAIIVSGGAGGAGAIGKAQDTNDILGTLNGVSTTIYGEDGKAVNQSGSTVKSYDIDRTMSDIVVEILSGGGAGGAGVARGGYPASQADCGDWGFYIDSTAQSYAEGTMPHSFCMAVRNPGDGGSDSPSRDILGITSVPAGSTCPALESGNCCWYGNTANSARCNSIGGSYSGCNRTVCQWNASRTICSAWRPSSVANKGGSFGRLPNVYELDTLAVHARVNGRFASWGGQKSLQICSINIPAAYQNSITNCDPIKDACMGTNDNNYCVAYNYWGDDGETSADKHSIIFISDNHNYVFLSSILDASAVSGRLFLYYSNSGVSGKLAYSPRCVIDNISKFEAYHGGGGAGGMYARATIPNETLRRAFINDDGTPYNGTLRLELTAPHGASTDEANTNNRSASAVARLYKGSTIIWAIGVPDASSGRSVDFDKIGQTDDGDPRYNLGYAWSLGNNWCTHFDKYSSDRNVYDDTTRRLVCSEAGFDAIYAGENGKPASNATPGYGGKAFWRSNYLASEGSYGPNTESGTSDDIDGKTGLTPGAGGSGSYCKQGRTRNEPICGARGEGAGGAARFTYKKTYPGIGGGGGASGTLLHIKNINVNPGELIKVQVGAAGGGGKAGANGTDGGNSYIELANGNKYEVIGGRGGKIGTQAVPSTKTYAIGGRGGEQSGITDETENLLKSLGKGNYEIFPSDLSGTKGSDAPATNPSDLITLYQSAGGNGGVNSKISGLAGNKGIPCGAYSRTPVVINKKKYECGSDDLPTRTFDAAPLYRSITGRDFELKTANYIQNLAPGGTGGAGGGWINSSPGSSANESIGQGADGMGGYVLIYFE